MLRLPMMHNRLPMRHLMRSSTKPTRQQTQPMMRTSRKNAAVDHVAGATSPLMKLLVPTPKTQQQQLTNRMQTPLRLRQVSPQRLRQRQKKSPRPGSAARARLQTKPRQMPRMPRPKMQVTLWKKPRMNRPTTKNLPKSRASALRRRRNRRNQKRLLKPQSQTGILQRLSSRQMNRLRRNGRPPHRPLTLKLRRKKRAGGASADINMSRTG